MPFSKLKGRKLMLCNMIYQSPSKKTDWKDYIVAVYRDLVTNEKETFLIEEPTIEIYEVKEEFRNFKKPRHFLPKGKLIPHEVKYKNVLREIANIGGEPYMEYQSTHTTKKERKMLYKYPYVLGADIDIETYYRCLWKEQLGIEGKKEVTKSFFD